ncbi:MAG: response regulator [Thermodesulfobacteria bacterium]|nr:response regulator [Thermodesulfobacteriota bacterium]
MSKDKAVDKRVVLVVEDDDEVRSMLNDYLTFLGYETVTAADGLEGLNRIKERPYDLVITDIAMPYVSGIGIISILKKEHPEIPVIAITGYGYHAEELAQEKNADYIMGKPFDVQKLKEAVEKLISSNHE